MVQCHSITDSVFGSFASHSSAFSGLFQVSERLIRLCHNGIVFGVLDNVIVCGRLVLSLNAVYDISFDTLDEICQTRFDGIIIQRADNDLRPHAGA